MNIVFTCGGTGGHIYPAIAVARMFRERQPDCKILFIGAEDGMENKLVPREGFRLETVKISNYQRKLNPCCGLAQSRDRAAHGCDVFKNKANSKGVSARCDRRYWRLRQLPGSENGREAWHSDLRTRIECRSGPDDKACCAYGQPCYGVFRVQPGALPGTPKRSS